jgi:hypothetical protein
MQQLPKVLSIPNNLSSCHVNSAIWKQSSIMDLITSYLGAPLWETHLYWVFHFLISTLFKFPVSTREYGILLVKMYILFRFISVNYHQWEQLALALEQGERVPFLCPILWGSFLRLGFCLWLIGPKGSVAFVSWLASLARNGAGRFISENKIASMVVPPQTQDLWVGVIEMLILGPGTYSAFKES